VDWLQISRLRETLTEFTGGGVAALVEDVSERSAAESLQEVKRDSCLMGVPLSQLKAVGVVCESSWMIFGLMDATL
jgi:hypothetical protein